MSHTYRSTCSDQLLTEVVPGLDLFSRYPGDCGIIATTLLLRTNYSRAHSLLRHSFNPTDGGVPVRDLVDTLKASGAAGNHTRQFVGTTLATYLKSRPSYRGLAIIKSQDPTKNAHAVAIIKGIPVNINPKMWDWDLTSTMKVQ